ncbi:hypothetical protein IFM89_037905 [Coptis chinensis]|uniref:Protein kinase domain-containing protein n=1 Tax=Coptis chinensis TaxID=261450 RepID=A0A835IH22_9MAGN|nr:hypothetical protein IFM89_037905 [Coptis chinensis]
MARDDRRILQEQKKRVEAETDITTANSKMDFTFVQMAPATNNFNNSTQIGQGGYGKVYKVILADGSIVAIKRAVEGSLQGEKEFLTKIELLSRVHHRNLVALMGYCEEEGQQVLSQFFLNSWINLPIDVLLRSL